MYWRFRDSGYFSRTTFNVIVFIVFWNFLKVSRKHHLANRPPPNAVTFMLIGPHSDGRTSFVQAWRSYLWLIRKIVVHHHSGDTSLPTHVSRNWLVGKGDPSFFWTENGTTLNCGVGGLNFEVERTAARGIYVNKYLQSDWSNDGKKFVPIGDFTA